MSRVPEAATHFAGRLRELREAARLIQTELAERSGVSARSISRIETGDQEPTWPVAVALAEALGITPNAFLPLPANPVIERKRGKRGRGLGSA